MVAALRSPNGASRWLLTAALGRKITMVVSVPLILEYEAVLTRQEHLSSTRLAAQQVSEMIDAVAAAAFRVQLSFRWRPLLADADDDMVLETAINGGAELLATFNTRDFGSIGERFGCMTVLPREAVRLVRERSSQEVPR